MLFPVVYLTMKIETSKSNRTRTSAGFIFRSEISIKIFLVFSVLMMLEILK